MIKIFRQSMFIAIACFFAMPVYAQTGTPAKKKAHTAKVTPPLPPDQSKMLCKAWQLDSIASFGVVSKVGGKEANDGITFLADSSFFFTQEGVAAIGKWMYAGGLRVNATTTNPDNKFSFKIKSLADARLVLDYQFPAPDLSVVTYIYSPKSK